MKFPKNKKVNPGVAAPTCWLALAGTLFAAGCASTPPPSSTPPPPPPPTSQGSPPPPSSSQQSQQDSQSQQTDTGEQQEQTQSPSGENQQAQSEQGDEQSQAQSGGQTGEQPGGSAGQTRAEQSRALGGEFERSLGEFDERLAREQGELQGMEDKQASANEQRAGQDGGQGDSGESGGFGDEQISRAPAPLPPANGGGQLPEEGSRRNGPGSPGNRASLPPAPDDVPSGQNDDVVARQLREAAENETDPELRKKLWDEYRQYKRNNG